MRRKGFGKKVTLEREKIRAWKTGFIKKEETQLVAIDVMVNFNQWNVFLSYSCDFFPLKGIQKS